jgi:hypothetical protein
VPGGLELRGERFEDAIGRSGDERFDFSGLANLGHEQRHSNDGNRQT